MAALNLAALEMNDPYIIDEPRRSLGHIKKGAARKSKARGVRVQPRTEPKVGRNEPCPCGSGKKYKYCCIK